MSSGFRASWAGTKFVPDVPASKTLFGNVKGKTLPATLHGWVVGVTSQIGVGDVCWMMIAVLPDGETTVQFLQASSVKVVRETEVL